MQKAFVVWKGALPRMCHGLVHRTQWLWSLCCSTHTEIISDLVVRDIITLIDIGTRIRYARSSRIAIIECCWRKGKHPESVQCQYDAEDGLGYLQMARLIFQVGWPDELGLRPMMTIHTLQLCPLSGASLLWFGWIMKPDDLFPWKDNGAGRITGQHWIDSQRLSTSLMHIISSCFIYTTTMLVHEDALNIYRIHTHTKR